MENHNESASSAACLLYEFINPFNLNYTLYVRSLTKCLCAVFILLSSKKKCVRERDKGMKVVGKKIFVDRDQEEGRREREREINLCPQPQE